MAGFEILKTKKINLPDCNVVEELDKTILPPIERMVDKFGQFKSIIVCEDEDGYLIVDGGKLFTALKKKGVKKILCYNLGDLKFGEYEMIRILMNVHQSRIDYLGIAEMIFRISKEIKQTTISNQTGLDLQSVERYSKLLEFDWDEFNRKQFNEQINPFEYDK